jgi:hypothetical protein
LIEDKIGWPGILIGLRLLFSVAPNRFIGRGRGLGGGNCCRRRLSRRLFNGGGDFCRRYFGGRLLGRRLFYRRLFHRRRFGGGLLQRWLGFDGSGLNLQNG